MFQLWEQLLVRDGVLFRQWESPDASRSVYQLVLPKSERRDVLRDLHEGVTGGHLGETKVLEKLKERFYWPGHVGDVKNWCQSCSACAQRKHPTARNKAKLQTVQEGYPMQMVATDILGPFPRVRIWQPVHLSCHQNNSTVTKVANLSRDCWSKCANFYTFKSQELQHITPNWMDWQSVGTAHFWGCWVPV